MPTPLPIAQHRVGRSWSTGALNTCPPRRTPIAPIAPRCSVRNRMLHTRRHTMSHKVDIPYRIVSNSRLRLQFSGLSLSVLLTTAINTFMTAIHAVIIRSDFVEPASTGHARTALDGSKKWANNDKEVPSCPFAAYVSCTLLPCANHHKHRSNFGSREGLRSGGGCRRTCDCHQFSEQS